MRSQYQTCPSKLFVQATAAPFLNAIYDREPLKQLVWGRVALLGEAAHPTTPHGLRSTNMAIGDAAALRRAFEGHNGDVLSALAAYQAERLAPTTREVRIILLSKICLPIFSAELLQHSCRHRQSLEALVILQEH